MQPVTIQMSACVNGNLDDVYQLELFVDISIANGPYEMCLTDESAMMEYNNKHGDNDYIHPHLIKNNTINKQYWFEAKEQLFWDGVLIATSIIDIFSNTHFVSVAKKIGNNDLRFQFKYKNQLLPMLVLQNYVQKNDEEQNNNIVNLISLNTLVLNNNKREYTLTLPENMSDEFKVDAEKESSYVKCKMRGVNHKCNIQSESVPIHSQSLILDNSDYNGNGYSVSEEKVNMIHANENRKN